METESGKITRDGLWRNNAALVQLLGLCPLLAVSSSVVNALGLGLATLFVLTASNTIVSLLRHQIADTIRLPAFVMIIAALVTCTELWMQMLSYPLYLSLGIFIPLIVTNCAILGRAEAFARRHPPLTAALDGFMMGLGFTWVLLVLGALREALGQGTLFANLDQLLGPVAAGWLIELPAEMPRTLLLVLPPGAFIATGLLIAGRNGLDSWRQLKSEPPTEPVESRRVRVTGPVA